MDSNTAELVIPPCVGHSVKGKLERNGDTDNSDEPPEKKPANFLDEENMENRTANWDIIPNEMRMLIVRRSFGKCSKNCEDLVKQTKLKPLKKVIIKFSKSWHISNCKTPAFKNLSFDKIQKAVKAVQEIYDHADRFIVDIRVKKMTESFRFPSVQMNVRDLHFKAREINEKLGYNLDINTLKQFCPLYLSSICLDFEKPGRRMCSEVYDLPQVYLPDKVVILEYSTIRDDQLLKLNAKRLVIEEAGCLTKQGVVQYLEKCLTELNTKPIGIMLQFHLPKDDHSIVEGLSNAYFKKRSTPLDRDEYYTILNTPYPEYKFKVYEYACDGDQIVVMANRIDTKDDYFNATFECSVAT